MLQTETMGHYLWTDDDQISTEFPNTTSINSPDFSRYMASGKRMVENNQCSSNL